MTWWIILWRNLCSHNYFPLGKAPEVELLDWIRECIFWRLLTPIAKFSSKNAISVYTPTISIWVVCFPMPLVSPGFSILFLFWFPIWICVFFVFCLNILPFCCIYLDYFLSQCFSLALKKWHYNSNYIRIVGIKIVHTYTSILHRKVLDTQYLPSLSLFITFF